MTIGIVFLLLSFFVYNIVNKKEQFFKSESALVFIGESGSFHAGVEAKRMKERDFLNDISKAIPNLDTDTLEQGLSLNLTDRDTLSITFISQSAQLAKKAVDSVSSSFVSERASKLESLKREKKNSLQQLSANIENLQRSLGTTQKKLRDLKAQNVESDKRRLDLHQRLSSLRLKRDELLKVFTDKHPDVVSARDQIDTIAAQIGDLPDSSSTYEDLRIKIERSQRIVSAKEKEYQQLYDTYKEAGEPWRVAVKKEATFPSGPIGRERSWYYLYGFLSSLLIAILCGFVLEVTDKRIYTRQEAEQLLKIPVIAEIDKPILLKGKKSNAIRLRKSLLSTDRRSKNTTKRFEQLYTFLKVDPLKGDIDKKVILIVSADDASGKTFVAANLALAAVHNGNRTLLVDANFRFPSLDMIFDFKKEAKGLSDILRGSAKDKEVVRNLTDLLLTGSVKLKEEQLGGLDNLKILSSGSKIDKPLGILGDKDLSKCLKELTDAYGILIIESVGIKSYPDTLNIAPLADAVLLIARRQKATYPLLKNTISQLKKINAPLIGLVLTDV